MISAAYFQDGATTPDASKTRAAPVSPIMSPAWKLEPRCSSGIPDRPIRVSVAPWGWKPLTRPVGKRRGKISFVRHLNLLRKKEAPDTKKAKPGMPVSPFAFNILIYRSASRRTIFRLCRSRSVRGGKRVRVSKLCVGRCGVQYLRAFQFLLRR